MQALYDLPAPAKLNLFLHITGQRSDGYHLLQSVFMLLDWCDSLHFERRNDGLITRQDAHTRLALPAQDLCVRAAQALQQATGCRLGAVIHLEKNIPTQAGMGGGSSDAATTLLALNRLWNLGLTRTQLQAIGITLGADVPFFLCGHNAWVEGIGDIMTPLHGAQCPPPASFAILKPLQGLETKAIFAHPQLQRNTKRATIAGFAAQHYDFGHNDLQPVAELLCPAMQDCMAWLQSQGLKARMTGSGSAVFAKIAQNFDLTGANSNWQVKICNNLPLHPLAGWASD